jgi:hypothetical protein
MSKFPKHHTMLLGDFIAKVGKDDLLKQLTGNESLQEISNYNGVGIYVPTLQHS